MEKRGFICTQTLYVIEYLPLLTEKLSFEFDHFLIILFFEIGNIKLRKYIIFFWAVSIQRIEK